MNGSVMPTINNVPAGALGISANRAKEFQMELLMEKLRTKTSQCKTLVDTSKAVRMAMLDKRWALDSADKAILQKCLDSLQHSIKVCSLQSLVERLDCLTRQLNLKFMVGQSGVDLFISSDMFYLEILLEPTGAVKDVKIHHEGKVEQQSCEELVSCISRGDFADFTVQLEGLSAMYQLNAEKKAKCRAFGALNALETDLATLGLMHSTKDPWAAVHKSPIGLVHNRRGGHAMKLTYFVSPYDAACCPNGLLTIESLSSGTGLSAQVMLESAGTHKLQLSPLLPRQQTTGPPVYAPLTTSNSTTLPARFVLKLSKPMVMCESLLSLMSNAAQDNSEAGSTPVLVMPPSTDMKPLLALIAQNSVTSDVNPNKGLFVTLPDQNQCYFLTESRNMQGCVMSSVPFTHPAQVPLLITRLRQQALFNALIASCVRPNSKQDLESSIMVEVSALSWQHISVLLEKPGEGGMATLELELPECGSAPRVTLYCGGNTNNTNSVLEERLSRVVARTLSIPLVVRCLLLSLSSNAGNTRWERQGFSGAQGGPDPGGAPPPHPHPSPHQGNFLNSDGQFPSQHDGGSNLSSMMGNGTPMDVQNTQMHLGTTQGEEKKPNKKRKLEEGEGGDVWRVKKSKPMLNEVLVDSSTSQSETGDESDVEEEINQLNNSSNDEEDQAASPSSPVGFGSDLELSGLDPAELMMGSSNENKTSGSDFENSGDGDINDSQGVDEMMSTPSKSESKKHKQKKRDHRSGSSKISTSSLLMELTEGGGLSASVSITPVSNPTTPTSQPSPSFSSVLGAINLDRRPGIEIIPISPNTQPQLPSSITITPISSSQAKSMDDKHRSDRKTSSSGKSSKSSSSDHSKEKKKKKKREDSMGPPDKLPPKQDPLTKPVSVSIKPTDGSHSPLASRSMSPNSFSRKFSPSPTHGRSVSITKTSSGSPGSVKSMGKPSGSSSHHSSPRHSPVQCSPKHTFSGYSSPKNHGTSSPKHSSGGGSSGKPSMSTLKSAASGSPSSKSSSGYELSKLSKSSSGKESSSGSSSREKDRKSSSGLSYSSSRSNSPKLKSSSVKLKQLDLSATPGDNQSSLSSGDPMVSPGPDVSKSMSSSQLSARNRKGSLSAVIDKLKSAQHCSETDLLLSKSSSSNNNKERLSSNPNKTTDSKSTSSSVSSKLSDSSKTQEYMVKPSSDGMKITINKTRTKDSSNSSSKSSSFSSSNSSSSNSSSVKQTSSVGGTQSATGSGSPKTHTGLKPGVISGPASKKPQVLQSSSKSAPTSSSSGTPVPSSGSPGMSSTKTSSNTSGSSGSSKVPFTKSSSGSSLSSSIKSSSKISTGSPKMSSSATDLSKQSRDRDREREKSRSKGTGEKSIFSSSKSGERRSSPAPSRDDVDGERAFKTLSLHKDAVNFYVEGFKKILDTSKYQIPKLSARASSDDPNKSKSSNSEKSSGQNASTDNRPKLMDYMGRPQDNVDSKYTFQHGSNTKSTEQSPKTQSTTNTTPSKPTISLSATSPKLPTPIPLLTSPKIPDNNDNLQPANFSMSSLSKSQSENPKDTKTETKSTDNNNRSTSGQPSTSVTKEDSNPGKIDFPKSYPSITVCTAETINQSIVKQFENKGFTIPQAKSNEDRKMLNADHSGKSPIGKLTPTQESGSDVCLDFSSSKPLDMKNKFQNVMNVRRHTPPLIPTQSPSLSVHIVKSPSPHSSSPCITDDELMDEAIVGPGK